ncbi:MAG TPA: glycosyltransferase family 2 protein [Candidatus Bathyarchaeia archaeon]|nr:glycosyltransferase family 2 protein [Candidatus Bathyarchaeia archaeon]
MAFFFWLFLFLIIYTYFGYPLVVMLWSALKPRPVAKGNGEPAVSVIISVWNEEEVIARRIQNLLEQDYPKEKMEILIGSDGSTDKTVEIIRSFSDTRVVLCDFQERRGKMAVLNDLVSRAKHEVLVFADGRQTFAPNAIRELVRNFADDTVGAASGSLVLSDGEGGTGKGVGLYWRYEKFLRRAESRIHSTAGVTGAIYAIRKALYCRIPEHIVLDDMYVPLKIVEAGRRVILDEAAVAFDKVAESSGEESRRKARTLFGNYQIFALFPGLFLPGKSPVAVQFFSHKFLRVVAPFLLIAIFLLNIALADHAVIYFWLMTGQFVFYLMAFAGAILRHETQGFKRLVRNLCYVPYVFCLLNFSAVLGFVRFLLKDQKATWEKAKSAGDSSRR